MIFIRKSRDFVYGIWQYKALNIKKKYLFTFLFKIDTLYLAREGKMWYVFCDWKFEISVLLC